VSITEAGVLVSNQYAASTIFREMLIALVFGITFLGVHVEEVGAQVEREEQSAIALGVETLGKIRSYRLKMTQAYSPTMDGTTKPQTTDVQEIWRDGLRHRRLSRMFLMLSNDGFHPVEELNGRMLDVSYNAREIRNMEGWDPDHPFQIPLDYGRNVREFSTVRCSIGVRDPKVKIDDVESRILLWITAPGLSSAELEARGNLIKIASPSNDIIRFRLESSNLPNLKEFEGMLIDVNLAYGGLVSRVERTMDTNVVYVTEVTDFVEAKPGIWLPIALSHKKNGQVYGTANVIDYEINEFIKDEDLEVQFPEGAQVNDANGNIILWGKSGPEKTFQTYASFMKELYARARESQAPIRAPLQAEGRNRSTSVIIIVNLILVGLLTVLFFIRWLLARHRQSPN